MPRTIALVILLAASMVGPAWARITDTGDPLLRSPEEVLSHLGVRGVDDWSEVLSMAFEVGERPGPEAFGWHRGLTLDLESWDFATSALAHVPSPWDPRAEAKPILLRVDDDEVAALEAGGPAPQAVADRWVQAARVTAAAREEGASLAWEVPGADGLVDRAELRRYDGLLILRVEGDPSGPYRAPEFHVVFPGFEEEIRLGAE